jgi:hypothetical protein
LGPEVRRERIAGVPANQAEANSAPAAGIAEPKDSQLILNPAKLLPTVRADEHGWLSESVMHDNGLCLVSTYDHKNRSQLSIIFEDRKIFPLQWLGETVS